MCRAKFFNLKKKTVRGKSHYSVVNKNVVNRKFLKLRRRTMIVF